MKQTWIIPENEEKVRLDIFLRDQVNDLTRSALAKLIKSGHVTVNGKEASVHRFLKVGDTVRIEDNNSAIETKKQKKEKFEKELDLALQNLPPLKIVKETDEWIVINKPTGLLVHPDAKVKIGTLADILVAHDPKIAKIGEDPSRPGIMHRLDKDVSGLMVIAKTQDAFDSLKKQFAEHSIQKTYLALAYGHVAHEEGDIKFRIARSKSKARMAALPESETDGQAAWTHYKIVKRFRTASLLELEIYTGRTHQIRAHLFGLGHPIVGDTLYAQSHTAKRIVTPRILLQAIRLSFKDPTTEKLETFTLTPDPAFENVMAKLSPDI
ncbi:MAG: RluA family pseudouridine synthase [bacterium]|nr:RluA family pseudouridine synthase [bacterium]